MKKQNKPISKISIKELEQRAKENDAEAFWELGNRSYKDDKIAFSYWKKAAELGYTDAYQDLGICYENGEGVRKNIAKAIKCYKMSMHAGNHQAITNLGYIYETIKKDYAKAKKLYEQAAQLNEHIAINTWEIFTTRDWALKKMSLKQLHILYTRPVWATSWLLLIYFSIIPRFVILITERSILKN